MPSTSLPGATHGADGRTDFRWLMSSDVCKHCTHAACLDVCPTGALFRTEFGTVVVQDDICNGCGYCVPACPFGVIDRRVGDENTKNVGIAQKCTLCYDRLEVGKMPACAQACPTESIQFGDLDEMRARARERVDQLHDQGVTDARLYLDDPDDGIGGGGSMFLLLDEPEVYGLPPDPVVTTRDLPHMWRNAGLAALTFVAGAVASFLGRRRMTGPDGGRRTRDAVRRRRAVVAGPRRGGAAEWCDAAGASTAPWPRWRRRARRSRCDVHVVLRPTGAEGSAVAGGHPGVPVPRWVGRRLIAARRRRRSDRPSGAPSRRPSRRAHRDHRRLRRARPRSRPTVPLREHAAGGQADVADVRRHLDPHRLRPAGRRGRCSRDRCSAAAEARVGAATTRSTRAPGRDRCRCRRARGRVVHGRAAGGHGHTGVARGLSRAAVRVRRLGRSRGGRSGHDGRPRRRGRACAPDGARRRRR